MRHDGALTACETAMTIRVWLQAVAFRSRAHVSCQPHVGDALVGRNSREVKTIILNHVNVQYLSASDDS